MDGSQGRPEGQKNVLGGTLQSCSHDPLTGFFRDGCCHTGPNDQGLHTVCAIMTDEFLEFSKIVGNDLSTPAAVRLPRTEGWRPVVPLRRPLGTGP